MKPKNLVFKAYRIEWHDACANGGWKNIDNRVNETTMLINSIGYLIHEDKKKLVLAQNMSDKATYSDTITIPIGWIKSRKFLGSELVFKDERN